MSALAEMPTQTSAFLEDLTPDSGLALRWWTPEDYCRIASSGLFGPAEHLDLVEGEIVERGVGTPRSFNCKEYYRLAELEILAPDERTELIYGRIITRMSPMGRPHSVCIMNTMDVLEAVFGDDYTVEPQMPIRLGSGLEPQPDIIVLPGQSRDYTDVPSASDLVLLVEISDSTLRYDQGTKARMYAAEGIPDYWLVNLRARTLEVRRQPESGEYQSLTVYSEGETIAPLASPDALVRVVDLLPLSSQPTQ